MTDRKHIDDELDSLVADAEESPAIREEEVRRVREAIASGTYDEEGCLERALESLADEIHTADNETLEE